MADGREILAKYEDVLARCQEYHAKLRDDLIPRVAALLSAPVPVPALRPIIQHALRKPLEDLYEIEGRVAVFLASAPVVVRLYVNGEDWGRISTTLSSVAGDLRWENRPVPTRWSGEAAEVYEKVVAGQLDAVEQLRAGAQTIAYGLHWLAMSILLLYVGLLTLLIDVCAIVIGALLSFAGGPATMAAGLSALGTALPAIVGKLTLLAMTEAAAYGRARTFIHDMRVKVLNMSTFPNGNWPSPDPARYNDATVRDGDPSDWTVKS
jgi:uncharacterized protein YukE